MSPRGPAIVTASCFIVVLAACSDGGGYSPTAPPPLSPPLPASDSLSIVTVSPVGGSVLPANRRLTITAKLAYELADATSADLGVSYLCTRGTSWTCLEAYRLTTQVRGPRGEIVVDVSLTPQPSQLRLTFELYPIGSSGGTNSAPVIYTGK